jgi:hypothetical protein
VVELQLQIHRCPHGAEIVQAEIAGRR